MIYLEVCEDELELQNYVGGLIDVFGGFSSAKTEYAVKKGLSRPARRVIPKSDLLWLKIAYTRRAANIAALIMMLNMIEIYTTARTTQPFELTESQPAGCIHAVMTKMVPNTAGYRSA